jgi:hypothetical protein
MNKPIQTKEEIMKQVWELCQMAKEVQNSPERWPEEHWRKISKAIERLEEKVMK